ncbi:restriction endonuclease [uncultured Methanobacterium sp.]|uniref:restriction endonuclease n=1 Tax=uncultured Methanobacterium sp. TaxID=176306 RepID=UPI002AA77B08|nr:restriction endonuclease [uncultured Methanobacterium sp.]
MISKIPLSEKISRLSEKISRLSEKIFALTKKMSITQFRENNFNTQNIFLILISFSGLFFLVAMYLWSPQSTAPSTSHYSLNESIILFLFIVICILGMFAAIYPSKCKTLLKFQNDSKQKTINQGNMQFEGHHPDCGKFSSHTLTINGRKYCPGCFGLSVGALLATVGVVIYYFLGYPLMEYPSIYGEISFWIGVCTVFAALLIIILLKVGIKLKFISNMALVTGSLLVLVGLDIVKGNLITELYFLILVIFWILTRIAVSENSHEIICQDCLKKSACVYE